jgi:hypothetical protein
MDSRFPPAILPILLIFIIAIAGCTSTAPVTGSITPAYETAAAEKIPKETPGNVGHTMTASQNDSIAGQLASVRSTNPVWQEAYRMFQNMKSTEYVHPPYTDDDAAGIYKFDCLGFVDHVLMNADPAGYKAIGKGVNPSIESYAEYFNKLSTTSTNTSGWTMVSHSTDLKPGDICLWLKHSTLDTGHMWIIAGEPRVNPKRTDEVLVRIFDSTGTSHSDDSRTGSAFRTGLGSGILGYMVNGDSNPIGLYWEGGASTSAGERDTTIICGRLNQ